MLRSNWRVALFCLVWTVDSQFALAGPSLPEAVQQALEANAKALNPITVTWRMERSSTSTPRAVLQKFGWKEDEPWFFLPVRVRFTWQDGMTYAFVYNKGKKKINANGREIWDENDDEWEQEFAFDGTNYYAGLGLEGTGRRGEHSGLGIQSIKKLYETDPDHTMMLDASAYYHEAGFKVPQTVNEYVNDARLSSLLLWLIKNGAEITNVRETSLDGAQSLAVELKVSGLLSTGVRRKWDHMHSRVYTFHLDPALGYAVRRREERSAEGKLGVLVNCSDFVQLSDSNVWLPKVCKVDYYTYKAKILRDSSEFSNVPIFVESFTVTQLNTQQFPKKQFTVSYDHVPGSIVTTDAIAEHEISYQVPAESERLDEAIQAALKQRAFVPAGSSWRAWVIAVNVVLVAILSTMYLIKRSRATGKPALSSGGSL